MKRMGKAVILPKTVVAPKHVEADDLAALKARNSEIAMRAIGEDTRYSELGRLYGVSGERIRQIVSRLDPVGYLEKRHAPHGRCPRCHVGMRAIDFRRGPLYRLADMDQRYCRKCCREIYKRRISLRCRCGKQRTIPWGQLLRLQSRGVYVSVQLAPGANRGTYVCRTCCRSVFGNRKGRMIVLTCRCGATSRHPLGDLLKNKSRGCYKSAQAAADGRTGTYVCQRCHVAAKNKVQKAKKRRRSNQ